MCARARACRSRGKRAHGASRFTGGISGLQKEDAGKVYTFGPKSTLKMLGKSWAPYTPQKGGQASATLDHCQDYVAAMRLKVVP